MLELPYCIDIRYGQHHYTTAKFADCCRTLPKRGAVGVLALSVEATVNINLTGNRLIRAGPVFRATRRRRATALYRSYAVASRGVRSVDLLATNSDPPSFYVATTTVGDVLLFVIL